MARIKGYGQFCPVSRAAEILAERWTPLVVRELLCDSTRFNDIQRGVPLMSSSLLSRRLKALENAGIVDRQPIEGARGNEYHLTEAGRDLSPLVDGMGLWAQRWVRDDLVREENLDPTLLMWDVRRNVIAEEIPVERRYVVRFEFRGMPHNRRRFWLVFDTDGVDLCMRDYGFEVDLVVAAQVKPLVQVWLGHVPMAQAIRDGQLQLEGTARDARAFSKWFALSTFAEAGRRPPAIPAGR
jgi:DNA-binding HxlR family transcriptional regulator